MRLSRDEEKKGIEEVLKSHRETLMRLAKQHDIQFSQDDIYEEVSSGMNSNREELNRLIQNIDLYDYVLVMDIDRLTRDNIYAEQLKQIFIMNDIIILSPGGELNFENESSELVFSFQSLLANYEWKQIRKRMSQGRLNKAREGKWVISNKTPLGYQKAPDKRLIINENEAKIIRLMFARIIQGYSAYQITKELDQLGWRTRSGKFITTSHITNYRNNPVYYGAIEAKRRVNGRVVEECFVEGAHEPIISKQDFFRAQKIYNEINEKRGIGFRRRGEIRVALQGLIHCEKCNRKRYIAHEKRYGKALYIKTCSYKVDNKNCKDRGINYQWIEDAVLKEVKKIKPKFEEQLRLLRNKNITDIEKKLFSRKSDLEQNKKKLEKRVSSLAEMRADGEITKIEYIPLKEKALAEIENIKQQIELIELEIGNLGNTEEQEKIYEENIKTLDNLDKLDTAELNAFLKTIIKRIRFSSNITVDESKEIGDRPEPTLIIDYID